MDWLLSLADVETLKHIGGEALQSQIGSLTFALTIAFHIAWRKVRKEMRAANQEVVNAITGHTTAISGHSKRIEDHEVRIVSTEHGLIKLTTRVESLETKEKV